MKRSFFIGWALALTAAGHVVGCDSSDENSGSNLSEAGMAQGAAPAEEDHHEEEEGADPRAERLLIADGEAAQLSIFDVAAAKIIETWSIASPARVYAGPSGRYGYAVQSASDRVQIVDSALEVVPHGDHDDYEQGMPTLSGHTLEGETPIHFVGHSDRVTVFFDDDGEGVVFRESELAGASLSTVVADTGMPHHGAALALTDARILATVPELAVGATRASPQGVGVHDALGVKTAQSFTGCPVVHGEASIGESVAFGCGDGVLVVEAGASEISAKKIANPPFSGTGRAPRVGTLIGHDARPYFVGNWGPTELCRVDATGEGSITPFPAPSEYGQFAWNSDGSLVLVLGKNGTLYFVRPESGAVEKELAVTSAATGADHGAKDPQMAVGSQHVYITDPAGGTVVIVDATKQSIVATHTLGGKPAKIAVLRFR